MEFKCEYCNGNYDDTLENCPHCGAQNNHIRRVADATPKTIAELKQWYIDRKLPPSEVTRFFIGENYTKPRAFGIYEENGKYIVYKNKDTGERAIRYEGTDEAYAVNELYLKLKSEILNQKANGNRPRNRSSIKSGVIGTLITLAITFAFIAAVVIDGLLMAVFIGCGVTIVFTIVLAIITKGKFSKKIKWPVYLAVFLVSSIIAFFPARNYSTPHYYRYDDAVYCNYHGNYYYYDSYDYYPVDYSELPESFTSNKSDYEYNWSDDDWNDTYDFSSSNYYSENFSSSSDSSYDWDSSSDSWDSGGSDWGSDWLNPVVGNRPFGM